MALDLLVNAATGQKIVDYSPWCVGRHLKKDLRVTSP